MDIPMPWGVVGRIWRAIRENPCTIEIVEGIGGDPRQYIRIRNDSPYPVQLFGASFRWRLKDSSKFDRFDMPMVWLLSERTRQPLEPGHSFEHPVDAHELGKPVAECIIAIEHNRQPKPEEKRFAVKY